MSFKYERFLIEAIEQCDLQKVINFIKHGHNIHLKNNLGQNLLIHLLKQQNYEDPSFEDKRLKLFQYLIEECNLDIHIVDYYNKNLFNWATNLDCTQEAIYLLDSYSGDLDLLKRDHSGLCSLHYAIEHGNEIIVHAIVNYFLHYRIRFDIKDNYDNTPEELARKLGYINMAEYLSDASRSTIFISREVSFLQHRPTSPRLRTTGTFRSKTGTNRLKTTTTLNTKSNMTTLLSYESSSVFLLDTTELYNLFESKIEAAKNCNDWKTVAALRTYKGNLNNKKFQSLRKFPHR